MFSIFDPQSRIFSLEDWPALFAQKSLRRLVDLEIFADSRNREGVGVAAIAGGRPLPLPTNGKNGGLAGSTANFC